MPSEIAQRQGTQTLLLPPGVDVSDDSFGRDLDAFARAHDRLRERGFKDPFNKIRELVVAHTLGPRLRVSVHRDGDDAYETPDWSPVELKSTTVLDRGELAFSTSRLTRETLCRWQELNAFYLSAFDGLTPLRIWRVPIDGMRDVFAHLDAKLRVSPDTTAEREYSNNPKFPLELCRAHAEELYADPRWSPVRSTRARATRRPQDMLALPGLAA